MLDCIYYIITYINDNGRFTVSGWYKKGKVDDQSNRDISVAIDSAVMSIYPVYIVPSNLIVIFRINNIKFVVSTIHNEN